MSDWDDAERRVEKAQELFEQHRWPEALEELRAAISINPYNGGWFFNIGLTLDEMGRFDEAIEAYRAALEIEPHDLQALDRKSVVDGKSADLGGRRIIKKNTLLAHENMTLSLVNPIQRQL